MPTRIIITILLALSLGGFTPTPTSINPKDYGVTFSGSDDTAGWQAAINAAIDTGLPLAAPCGKSQVKGRLIVAGSLTFGGGGMDCTILMTAADYTLIVTTTAAVQFRDFSVYCPSPSAGQYGISFYASGRNFGSVISHVRVDGCYIGIDLYTNSQFVVDGAIVDVADGVAYGIRVADANAPDAGDGVIVNCTFGNGALSGVAVLQYSGGGLKVANNKFYGFMWGYLLSLAPGVETSELQIIGNNFDRSSVAIGLSQQPGAPGFSSVIVANNLASNGAGGFKIYGGGWVSGVYTSGNSF